ncbi:cytochrome b [Reinekea thalattae]|uniref:Cytochrome b n=1 Tax=Reinekea thalattae TaxID=2593301 RepID=A0A5C8Z9K2_9GAMM|nr:cytochrome b [Reinekea thalattae]TXR54417.1 cytochrome b [Reinekea thalattae]
MNHSSNAKNYSWLMISIHWLSALVVIAMFALGLWMVGLDYYSQWYQTAPALHKSVGILLFALTAVRFGIKLASHTPEVSGKIFEVIAAKAVHLFIYFLILLLFVSGYLISTPDGRGIEVFNWFTIPSIGELFENQSTIAGRIHYFTALTLIAFAALHALAALKHHFIDKDNTLKKMMGTSK